MYRHMLLLLLTLFLAFRLSNPANASEWSTRAIYQIVTDRFARSDGSLTSPCDPRDRRYCGGTWRGIINHLDYILNMGFDAIWITPIVQQISGTTYEGEAYHGYWPENIYALNTNFGTEQDFKDLVAACHSREMYLMVDIVINHFAHKGETPEYDAFVPFSHERYFHPRCPIDWGNQTSIEQCWMGDGYVSLADTNTENREVIDTWKKYLCSLGDDYGVDGFRLDACRNIPKQVLGKISRAAHVYSQGEVWDRDPNVVCPYQEYVDGMHNYPFKELATDAFISSAKNLSEFVDMMRRMQVQCKDVRLFGNFIENHDNPRVGSFTTDIARLRHFAVLICLTDGIPIVYYGQEQVLTGSNDPSNREALWPTGYATTNNLVPTFAALNRFRKHLIKTTPFIKTWATYTLLSGSVVMVRKGDVVLVLTNSGKGVVNDTVVKGFPGGTALVDVLTCGILYADGTGEIRISLAGEPMVLYPKSLLDDSGICGL